MDVTSILPGGRSNERFPEFQKLVILLLREVLLCRIEMPGPIIYESLNNAIEYKVYVYLDP